jgi:hypothetical protein
LTERTETISEWYHACVVSTSILAYWLSNYPLLLTIEIKMGQINDI